MFRLFIDECGHADLKSAHDPRQQYLGLTGIIMRRDYEAGRFTDALNLIKKAIFGRDDIVFHRKEMLHALPPFECLRDAGKRAELDEALLQVMEDAAYRAVTVVVDKKALLERYTVWRADPYHYGMRCLLERYIYFLQRAGVGGDVMTESRERRDNHRLSRSYRYAYKHGTEYLAGADLQRYLPTNLKISRKKENVAGLQLCDLIANPSCRELICRKTKQEMTADFGKKIVEILYRRRYRRNPNNGKVEGYGTKWLP